MANFGKLFRSCTMQVSSDVAGKRSMFQFLAVFSGVLSTTCSGMHYGWPSPSLPQLLANDSYIPMSNSEGSWVAIALPIGALNGSILAAIVINIFGRKPVILFSSIPFFISWIMLATARSVSELITGRLLARIPDGLAICAMPMYLGEISNQNVRGFFGSLISVAFIFGIFLINIIGSFLSISTTAFVSSLLPVLLFLTSMQMPESPYYLITKGKFEEARCSLKTLKELDDVEAELTRLIQVVDEQTANRGKYLDLFTVKSNRKALYIIMGTRGVQQFSGMAAIMFYAQLIFQEIGSTVSPKASSIIYFGIQVVCSGFSATIVDKIGRRPLLIVSLIGCFLSMSTAAFYFCIHEASNNSDNAQYSSLVPAIALVCYVIMFAFGLQAIPVLLLGEMFPTNVKAFALSFADVYFVIITALVAKFFQITKDEFGLHVPFFVFSVCCCLGVIVVVFYVPETKGKTLEEIQIEIGGMTMHN